MASKRFSFLSALVIFLVCSTCSARDALFTGERLSTGQILINGIYFLSMQYNCNLVLYAGVVPLWSSGTAGQGVNCYATFLSDGRLAVNSGSGTTLWVSPNSGNVNSGSGNVVTGDSGGNYALILQPDRNLAIYGPRVWATNTQVPAAASTKNKP